MQYLNICCILTFNHFGNGCMISCHPGTAYLERETYFNTTSYPKISFIQECFSDGRSCFLQNNYRTGLNNHHLSSIYKIHQGVLSYCFSSTCKSKIILKSILCLPRLLGQLQEAAEHNHRYCFSSSIYARFQDSFLH